MPRPRVLVYDADADHPVIDMVAERNGVVHRAIGTTELARELESEIGWDLLYVAVATSAPPCLRAIGVIHETMPALPIVLELDLRDVPAPLDLIDLGQLVRCGASDLVTDPTDLAAIEAALDRAIQVAQGRREWAAGLANGRVTALGDLHVVTATGGGTGRTVFATNVAATLAAQGRRTCLIDLDHPFGGIALAMQVTPTFTVLDAVGSDVDELVETLPRFCEEVEPGLFVLAAGGEHDTPPSTVEIEDLVLAARRAFDHVVVDCPPTPNPVPVALLPLATSIWCIETPDLRSLRALKVLTDGLSSARVDLDRFHVVLNKYSPGLGVTVDDLRETIGREPTLVVPYDRRIGQALNSGVPVVHRASHDPMARSLFDRISTTLLATEPESDLPIGDASRTRVLAGAAGVAAAAVLAARGVGWI